VDLCGELSSLPQKIVALFARSVAAPGPVVRTDSPVLQAQTRLTSEEVDSLLAAYHRGMAIPDMAKLFGVNRDTVYEHLRRTGNTPNRINKLSVGDIQTARDLYASGLSLARTGQQLCVNARTIREALAAAGATIRPRRGSKGWGEGRTPADMAHRQADARCQPGG
jgi:predicted DNA-binding protein YlxM (UPF0122 family)